MKCWTNLANDRVAARPLNLRASMDRVVLMEDFHSAAIPVLETDRLILRPHRLSDLEACVAL